MERTLKEGKVLTKMQGVVIQPVTSSSVKREEWTGDMTLKLTRPLLPGFK